MREHEFKRIFEGIVEHQRLKSTGEEWWELAEEGATGYASADDDWLMGLEGKRVRLIVEVFPYEDGEGAA